MVLNTDGLPISDVPPSVYAGLRKKDMTKKILSLIGLGTAFGTAHSLAATVADMSGTVFSSQQFHQPSPAGIPQPIALALFGGAVLVFTTLFRRLDA